MTDNNLINVENFKATILKIRDWVKSLYPITYNKATPELKATNVKVGAQSYMDIKGDGITSLEMSGSSVTLGQDTATKNHLSLADVFYAKYKGKTSIFLGFGANMLGAVKVYLGNSLNNIMIDDTTGEVSVGASKSISLTANGGHKTTFDVKEDSKNRGTVTLKDTNATKKNMLCLGITPSEVIAEPNGIYLGSKYRLGYSTEDKVTNYSIPSGTTYNEMFSLNFTDSGVYQIQWRIGCVENIGDATKFAGRVTVDGTAHNESRMAIVTSASTTPSIGGGAIVEVTSGTHTVALNAYQSSGSAKKLNGYIRIIKIA